MAKVVSKSRLKILLVGCLFWSTSQALPAQAGGSGFDDAKSLYQKKNYSEAAKQFQKLIDGGDKRAIVYIYLAHSFYMQKDKAKAIRVYEKIVKNFPGTSEAKLASGSLTRLGAKGGKKAPAGSSRKSGWTESLIDRIEVIPPRFGHPKVSENTVSIVRGVLSGLPKRLYRILDEGGAKPHIASNMLDRWPKALYAKHPADGHLYCNEPGRTYDLDMYVFERPLAREGFKDVGDMWSDQQIRVSTYMQCAHALDYLMEHLSSDPEYKKFYSQDLNAIPRELKAKLPVFVANTKNARIETFGEIMLLEMDVETGFGPSIKKAFPRTRMFVKDSIKRIELK